MSLALLATIGGIALLDSLNPSLFLAQFYLLTTARPVPRILSYIGGVVAANFLGGLLFLLPDRTSCHYAGSPAPTSWPPPSRRPTTCLFGSPRYTIEPDQNRK
ncbi:MAG TPA: hypothetical protein VFS21_14450 [Roseiflexaceae bacterium]|nr:hypothetical protein [Roseiflexaceae bacterium]